MEKKVKKKISSKVVCEGKSFEEELDDLKVAIRKMQKARSHKGQPHVKTKRNVSNLPPLQTSSGALSISTMSPSAGTEWIKEFREKNVSSPCPRENLERIKREASPSISKKRERKDRMQKRLTELFVMAFSSSTSFDPSVGHLCDSISGDNMIHEIPTLSAEDTLSTAERNFMRSDSLSEDISLKLSSDRSMEEKAIKPTLIPQSEFTTSIVVEEDESNVHPLESPRKVLKSTHFSKEPSSLKRMAKYQLKPHFSLQDISVSGNLYSLKIF
jgi:hypothetical protein